MMEGLSMNSDRVCGRQLKVSSAEQSCVSKSCDIGKKVPKPRRNPRNRNKKIMNDEAVSCKLVENKFEHCADVLSRSELVKGNFDCINNSALNVSSVPSISIVVEHAAGKQKSRRVRKMSITFSC